MSAERIEVAIDLDEADSPRALHELLESRLGFPGYYGRNWDAFRDCIRDPEQSSMPDILVLRNWPSFEKRLPRDAKIMHACLQEFSIERPECEVLWA